MLPLMISLLTHKNPRPTGTESSKAVKNDNFFGEKFPNLNITAVGLVEVKLISNPFYGSDTIHVELLPDLPDVHINGTVANNHFVSPNAV